MADIVQGPTPSLAPGCGGVRQHSTGGTLLDKESGRRSGGRGGSRPETGAELEVEENMAARVNLALCWIVPNAVCGRELGRGATNELAEKI